MSSSASSSPASSHHHGVFLSNVDDYVAPSQACVNPLFSTTSTEAANNNKNNNGDKREPNANGSAGAADTATSARPTTTRRRRRQRTALVVTEDSNDPSLAMAAPPQPPKTPTTTVQASLADCLACSGCVTTTETVLLEEQHSLDILRQRLQKNKGNNNPTTTTTTVLTLSPASWADLMRHLQLPLDDVSQQQFQKQRYLRQFTHWLCQSDETAALQIQYVVDDNLPLQWSLQQAADEFCRAYQHKQQSNNGSVPQQPLQHQQWQRDAWPSRATARGQLQFVNPQDGVVHDVTVVNSNKLPPPSNLPLLSGSCPAAVCLVEKTTHTAVPHVASTVSPMSLAGAWWKRHNNSKSIFHVAVMPCHDKKLEASRKDFYDATTQMSDVDLVLTSLEFWTLLQEAVMQWHVGVVDDDRTTETADPMDIDSNKNDNNNVEDQLRRAILEAPLASVSQTIPAETNGLGVLLAEELEDNDATKEDVDMVDDVPASSTAPSSSSPFVHGSGGYADFIFRYACQHLFGVCVDQVPWEPVTSSSYMDDGTQQQQPLRSARVAQRHRQARDFYQATLYRTRSAAADGSFYYSTTRPVATADGTTCEPVLRFAIAYGMQTLQRILKPFESSPGTTASPQQPQHSPFDYIEAMACPSGCLNGGGQVRAAASSLGKETPTETRHRLAQTQRYFATPSTTTMATATIPVPPEDRHTTYHVVPPMQLAMGAAAGVAVKDLQW